MHAVRIAVVTLGLIVAGAMFGGLAGTIVMTGWFLSDAELRAFLAKPDILLIGTSCGGVFGAVLGPLGAWLLMRRVPLGLAFGGTLLGTIIGGAVGLALTGNPATSVYAGMAGFGLAAGWLRRSVPREGPLLRG